MHQPSPAACLCYFVDTNYLFPTLVSALQARHHIPAHLAEVVIVCVCAPSPQTAAVHAFTEKSGIRLIEVDASVLDGMHPMWGRMFLQRILPAHLERILYLDGDTQIVGSLAPLFEYDLPRGLLLATRDPILSFARLGWPWKGKHEQHCARIGFSLPPDRYFNSGLLLFHRADWSGIAEQCFAVNREKGDSFVYPDQDALNLVVADRALILSDRWNFPGFLMGSPAERARQPHIYHFFSNPRPWLVAAQPWGSRGSRPYQELLHSEPALAPIAPSYSLGRRLKYKLQQRFKMAPEYRRVGQLVDELPIDLDL